MSTRFATSGGPKWQGIEYSPGVHEAPVLKGAHAVLQCQPFSSCDAGDHRIIIGEVIDAVPEDEVAPLVFYRGRYACMSDN